MALIITAIVTWNHLGGWPEAHYRIWGIPWFRQVIFEESGDFSIWIVKTEKIHHSSAPSFSNSNGEWQVDSDNDTRYHGRPSRYYRRGDSRQIPINTWQNIVLQDYKNEKGEEVKTATERWLPIDPELLKAAYDDDSIERARAIGRKLPFPIEWILVAVLIVGIIAGISVYYSHDTYCAIKPMLC